MRGVASHNCAQSIVAGFTLLGARGGGVSSPSRARSLMAAI